MIRGKGHAPSVEANPRNSWISRLTWFGLGVAVLLVTILGLVVVAADGDEPGEPAPDIVLSSFEGEPVRLSDFEGQGVVVNYWASWCAPCLTELPGFEQVYQRHRERVAFLGINLADDPTSALAVAAKTGITYPLAVDADGSSFAAFGGLGMPTTIFISEKGRILETYTGPLTAALLEEKVEALFGA